MSNWIALALLVALGLAVPTAAAQERRELPPSLAAMTPSALATMPVIGRDDETIGRVDEVAQDQRSGELVLILRTDQGERLALDTGRVEAVDGQLRLLERLERGELERRIEEFTPDAFIALPRDAELAAWAQAPSA